MTIPAHHYARIRDELEAFPGRDGKTIWDTEFAWGYNPKTGLTELKPSNPSNLSPCERMIRSLEDEQAEESCRYEIPTGGDARAFVHNHLADSVRPSPADISTHLTFMQTVPGARFHLIAATYKGSVMGFNELEFHATASKIKRLIEKPENITWNAYMKRAVWIQLKSILGINNDGRMFTAEEYDGIAHKYLRRCGVTSRTVPMPGFVARGWMFEKSI